MTRLESVPAGAVILDLPFRGSWRVQMSPANRVPSHGTHAFGTTYAIDFVPVDARGRTAPRTWRGLLAPEPAEVFVGFGRPVLAPVAGEVVAVRNEDPDHEGRRSQLALVPYMLGQARRARAGWTALTGNHVIVRIEATDASPDGLLILAHLRRGSVLVGVGDRVVPGQPLAQCGNSGNSTEPHLHLQVVDSTDWATARGLPLAFCRPGCAAWIPRNGDIVDGVLGDPPQRGEIAWCDS